MINNNDNFLALLARIRHAAADFVHVAKLAELPLGEVDIELIPSAAPHAPMGLPKGTMGVYIFAIEGKVLKVGKTTRNERAKYHHYGLNRSTSSLANTLFLNAGEFRMESEDLSNIQDWITRSTDRVDLRIKAHFGATALHLLEAFMIARLKPRFEGRVPKGPRSTQW